MAKTRVGINGFGRIGRNFLRSAYDRGADFEIVAFNDLGDAETMAQLLKYDSVGGRFDQDVEVSGGSLKVGGTEIKGLAERDPASLPWGELGVDIVIESTGRFTTGPAAKAHLDGGAKKVPPPGSLGASVQLRGEIRGVIGAKLGGRPLHVPHDAIRGTVCRDTGRRPGKEK